MAALTEEAVERNLDKLDAVGDLHVHHFVTRGKGRRAWSADGAQVGIRVSGLDFAGYYTAYDGLKAVITRTQSYHAEALDPKIKHYSRMNFNLAELEANEVDPGALPILRDRDGYITEGSSYNVFIVTGGVVRTPTTRTALEGVSRKVVLGLTSRSTSRRESRTSSPMTCSTPTSASSRAPRGAWCPSRPSTSNQWATALSAP